MPASVHEMQSIRVLVCPAKGEALASEHDVNPLVGAARDQQATMVALPVSRLTEDFFRLSTRVAGAIAQTFTNGRLRLAIVGDISRFVAHSKALHDFVFEANSGKHIWFVQNMDELELRLVRRAA